MLELKLAYSFVTKTTLQCRVSTTSSGSSEIVIYPITTGCGVSFDYTPLKSNKPIKWDTRGYHVISTDQMQGSFCTQHRSIPAKTPEIHVSRRAFSHVLITKYMSDNQL